MFEIEQILKSQDLKGYAHYNHHSKIINVTFGFPEFLSTFQKSVYSINSFLRYSQISCPENKVATSIFGQTHPNIFQSTFSFHEFASICKKSNFIVIILEIWLN